ncbi:MAG: arsenic efflux protein [Bacteroidetes bacterium]|uniref:Arsenic efflux protein n=1 Tax=Candidatus Cryptobacteroides excrementavium TaxID=2840759 RepID=A0A9D9J0C5_9BACT|nr:arsenic efflux protein [Candidatus Cryptobacteroides excrementavium]
MTLHLLTDILRNSILITGLVTIMMMLIEAVDLESHGRFFNGLKKTRTGQVAVSALLGLIPGCIGGFAAVSLYTQRLISFGALVAMMIASMGDEAFMLLALMPGQALWIFLLLFAVALVCGIAIDFVIKWKNAGTPPDTGTKPQIDKDPDNGTQTQIDKDPDNGMEAQPCRAPGKGNEKQEMRHVHNQCRHCHEDDVRDKVSRHFGWRRIILLCGTAVFLIALAAGFLDHEHHTHDAGNAMDMTAALSMNLLDEKWMNILFAALSITLLVIIWKASDHFVSDNLWRHIILKHMPVIFAWTFGVLAVAGIVMSYVEIDGWISQNTALMILLAAAIGLIPESGPHMIFVTLYAGGIVPFPVLLASAISQDGHSSLPLLAEDKRSFAYAKLLNCLIAIAAGFGAMLLCNSIT